MVRLINNYCARSTACRHIFYIIHCFGMVWPSNLHVGVLVEPWDTVILWKEKQRNKQTNKQQETRHRHVLQDFWHLLR